MHRPNRILLTGAAGALGRELCSTSSETKHGGKYFPPARLSRQTREKLDVTNVAALQNTIESLQPKLVIHLAAVPPVITNRQPDLGWKVNAESVHTVGKLCAHYGIPIIFISSADVFGLNTSHKNAYHELDTTGPTHCFGVTKVCAENAITQLGGGAFNEAWKSGFRYWIIRTSNLFSASEPHYGLVHQMRHRLAAAHEHPMTLADDVRTSWTYIPHLAKAIAWLVSNQGRVPCGVYHVVNRGSASHYEVGWRLGMHVDKANAFVAGSRSDFCKQQGLSTAQFPRSNALDTDVWDELRDQRMPTWEAAIEEYAKEIAGNSLTQALAA